MIDAEATLERIREAKHRHYLKNRDKYIERARRYREEHKDELREYFKEYCAKNRERLREAARDRYLRNYEKISEKQRKWRDANREKVRKYQREYYRAHRDAILRAKKLKLARKAI